MEEKYAGMIKTPDAWWLSKSRAIYDAWDLPEGPVRDAILSVAQQRGILVRLGPGSMDSAHAMAAARRAAFGNEVLAEEALDGFEPTSQGGQDFLTGTGEFAPDEGG